MLNQTFTPAITGTSSIIAIQINQSIVVVLSKGAKAGARGMGTPAFMVVSTC